MEAPKNYIIEEKYFSSQNYTPADVMRRWAGENYEVFGRCGTTLKNYIKIYGKRYFYQDWKIKKHADGTETVTIKLIREDAEK